ncbi:hypothetical protein [uncultured Bacteroides sp.]|uniref:hypothetical protein n=1 Tax=uncultured Bacteroides sp. TaxID=162156 RepID=UPI0025DAF942|nr:hypothetical protein [uncultured Bacteroides sp.]
MGNLKIGGQNVGKIFLGDKQISGGANNKFINTYGNPAVIVNKSNVVKRIIFDGDIAGGSSHETTITLNPTETALVYSPGNDDFFTAVDAMQVDIFQAYRDDYPDDPRQEVDAEFSRNVAAGEYFASLQSGGNYNFMIIIINN